MQIVYAQVMDREQDGNMNIVQYKCPQFMRCYYFIFNCALCNLYFALLTVVCTVLYFNHKVLLYHMYQVISVYNMSNVHIDFCRPYCCSTLLTAVVTLHQYYVVCVTALAAVC